MIEVRLNYKNGTVENYTIPPDAPRKDVSAERVHFTHYEGLGRLVFQYEEYSALNNTFSWKPYRSILEHRCSTFDEYFFWLEEQLWSIQLNGSTLWKAPDPEELEPLEELEFPEELELLEEQ